MWPEAGVNTLPRYRFVSRTVSRESGQAIRDRAVNLQTKAINKVPVSPAKAAVVSRLGSPKPRLEPWRRSQAVPQAEWRRRSPHGVGTQDANDLGFWSPVPRLAGRKHRLLARLRCRWLDHRRRWQRQPHRPLQPRNRRDPAEPAGQSSRGLSSSLCPGGRRRRRCDLRAHRRFAVVGRDLYLTGTGVHTNDVATLKRVDDFLAVL